MMTAVNLLHKAARGNMRFGLYTPKIREFCFIIGAMKSGTTTLYHYLAQHPEIAPNQFQKEPEFFSKSAAPANLAPYYRQWLPRPFRRQIALEASTGYTKQPAYPNVAERLKVLQSRKHFIVILRNPIDRIESHLAHNTAAGVPPEGDRIDFEHALAVSHYAMQLDAFRTAFPEIPIKIILFEDFCEDPVTVVREICRYLDIDTAYPFRRLPAQNIRSSAEPVQSVSLSAEQRVELAHRLTDDMARLCEVYGVDTSRWGFV